MKKYILSMFLVLLLPVFSIGQQCGCPYHPDSIMLQERIDCSRVKLKGGAEIYYQFNCDSVWLVLHTKEHGQMSIFSMGTELGGYNYRLGFQLAKDIEGKILFRYDCAANGPCEHILIDKKTGKKLVTFSELVYKEADDSTNLIIYLNDDITQLIVHDLLSEKKSYIPIISERFTAVIPEYQFGRPRIEDGKLILTYIYWNEQDISQYDDVIIDLKEYGY